MTELRAVLFDMDGTLVDSEKTWQAALADLAELHGATAPPATLHALLGATTADSIEILYADIGRSGLDHAVGGRWLEARVMTLFAAGVPWQPGARELLGAVRAAGVKTALVTATARHITEVMLDTMGRANFDAVITDDDVVNGKPHPDPYVTAAAALGVAPHECVAIEDSLAGCASAMAAGCAVLAVPTEVDLPHFTEVTTARSLADVDVTLLRELLRQRAGETPTSPAR